MRLEEEIKQNKFPNVWIKTEVNFLLTTSLIIYKNKLFFKKFDLSPQQYNVLRILRGNHPNCMSLKEIGVRMIDKMSNASRLVEKLQHKNMISTKENNIDKRQLDICITEKGLQLLAKIDTVIDQEMETHYHKLSETELNLLNSLLDRIR